MYVSGIELLHEMKFLTCIYILQFQKVVKKGGKDVIPKVARVNNVKFNISGTITEELWRQSSRKSEANKLTFYLIKQSWQQMCKLYFTKLKVSLLAS